jgi:hypothetical protein
MDAFDPSRTNHSAVLGPHTAPDAEILANNLIGTLRRITDDGVSIVAGGNTIAAYDGSSIPKWQITVAGIIDVAVGPEGHVYVSTATTLAAFDKGSGTPLWSSPYVGNDENESSSLAVTPFPDCRLRERTGLSRSTIWRLGRHGDFPQASENLNERRGVGRSRGDEVDSLKGRRHCGLAAS